MAEMAFCQLDRGGTAFGALVLGASRANFNGAELTKYQHEEKLISDLWSAVAVFFGVFWGLKKLPSLMRAPEPACPNCGKPMRFDSAERDKEHANLRNVTYVRDSCTPPRNQVISIAG